MPFASISAIALLGGAMGFQVVPVQPVLPSPLTRSAVPFSGRADVDAVAALIDSDPAAWATLVANEFAVLESIPLGPSIDATAALRRIDALAPGAAIVAVVEGAGGGAVTVPLEVPPIAFYAGPILGSVGGRVFLAHGAGMTHGYALLDGRTFVISSGPPNSGSPIVSYELSALPDGAILWSPFECLTESKEPVPQLEGGLAGTPPCRHVKIAFDSDNELNTVFGGDVTSTAAYMLLQAAAISEIYTAELNVRIQASFVRIWTVADPWTAGNSYDQLFQFRDYWNANMGATTRDAAMLLSARGLGGGIAWLSAMCGSYAYSVSGNLSGYFPYPLLDNNGQNWDIMVTAHELGHNMGTTHTHNFCPPVDQCAPSGYFGDCQTEQVCTNQGTIMSYCHLCGGGLGNVLLQFAPACIDAIESHLGGLECPLDGEAQAPWAVPDFVTAVAAPIAVDVLMNDLPVNCEAVVIDSYTQPSPGMGTVSLLAGAGPDGRDMLQYSPPPQLTGQVEFTYTLRDESRQVSLPGTVRVDTTAFWPPTSVMGAAAKIAVDYYDLVAPQVLPDFGSLVPFLTTTTSSINFPSTGGVFANSNRSDNFGAVWTGWVTVPTDAVYTFFLNSDDGSKLWIDDELLVSNDGLHGMVEKSGTAPLAAGRHAVRVEFFEAGGGAGCILSISGGGQAKAPIPASSFSHGGTVLLADFNLDGAVDGDDLGFLLGQWGSAGPEADLNGDGVVDGDDLGSLLGSWTG